MKAGILLVLVGLGFSALVVELFLRCPYLVLLGLNESDLRENPTGFQGRYPKPYFRVTAGESLVLENVSVPRVSGWEKEQESAAHR